MGEVGGRRAEWGREGEIGQGEGKVRMGKLGLGGSGFSGKLNNETKD